MLYLPCHLGITLFSIYKYITKTIKVISEGTVTGTSVFLDSVLLSSVLTWLQRDVHILFIFS